MGLTDTDESDDGTPRRKRSRNGTTAADKLSKWSKPATPSPTKKEKQTLSSSNTTSAPTAIPKKRKALDASASSSSLLNLTDNTAFSKSKTLMSSTNPVPHQTDVASSTNRRHNSRTTTSSSSAAGRGSRETPPRPSNQHHNNKGRNPSAQEPPRRPPPGKNSPRRPPPGRDSAPSSQQDQAQKEAAEAEREKLTGNLMKQLQELSTKAGDILTLTRHEQPLSQTSGINLFGSWLDDETLDFEEKDKDGQVVEQPQIPMFPEDFPSESGEHELSWWGIVEPIRGQHKFGAPHPLPPPQQPPHRQPPHQPQPRQDHQRGRERRHHGNGRH